MQDNELKKERRNGIITALMCYTIWGLLAIYWKLLDEVSPMEIISHRIIWCFVTMIIICLATRQDLGALFKDPRAWRHLVPSALIITLNWSIYIYAVGIDKIVEASMGYYINPLVTIILGVIVFKERLSRFQGIALLLCTIGVIYFTVQYGQFPWIAIALAVSFGIYGAIKKKAGYPAVPALAFENTVMLIPAIACAFITAKVTGSHSFAADLGSSHGIYITILLVIAGPATGIPLALFSRAANLIPLSLLGFIQYLSPTLTLLTGVLIFGEPFTMAHAVCLGFIWIGLALVTIDGFRKEPISG